VELALVVFFSAVFMGKVCLLSSVHTTIMWEGEAQPSPGGATG